MVKMAKKEKTTKDFAEWSLRTLRGYEKRIHESATLVMAGIGNPEIVYKTNTLELLLAMFIYVHGTYEEKREVLLSDDMGELESILDKYSKDQKAKPLDRALQYVWNSTSEYISGVPLSK